MMQLCYIKSGEIIMKYMFAVLLILFLCAVSLNAEDKMQIAVLDLDPKGTSKVMAGAVSDIIRSEMVKAGLFTVIERGQMDVILKEQGFQQTGCTDQACAVKLGKMLSARKILVGEINKIGQSFILTVRIVDVETGASKFAANEKAESEDTLDKAAQSITQKLSQNIVEGDKSFFVQRKTMTGYYLRSIVPGWGHIYADRNTRGLIYMGSFLAAAGLATYGYVSFTQAESDYNNVPRDASQSEFDSKYDAKVTASRIFLLGAGLTLAVYIANWVDALYFTKPGFDSTSASLTKSDTLLLTFDCVPVFREGKAEDIYSFSAGIRF